MSRRIALISVVFITVAAAALAQLPTSDAEHAAIAYSTSTPTDPVARLQQRIDAGELKLDYDAARGYLPAILRH